MEYKKDSHNRFIKVGVIVWTIDPDGNLRFLIRHNKPFNGYEDEWTISFGNVEQNETFKKAALREVTEEFGLTETELIQDLRYEIEFTSKKGETLIKFYAIKLKNIDTKILLNEESIGFDWMVLNKVKEIMQHDDEKKAFDVLITKKNLQND
ncbi:MAG: hypothetical protein ACD_19C00432G0011 [uncultured bacterium]|nr:MAG: hypothetical protein ACD_19C00432G0011 [uncultured bacterium]